MSAARSIKSGRRNRLNVGRALMLVLYLIFLLGPLYWVLVTSIKPSDDYLAVPPVWFPDEPTMVHFTAALFAYRGLDGLINSLIVSLAATALSALLGTLMAYSLARFNTGGRHLAFWFLSQRMMPPVVLVIPFYLLLREVGKINPSLGLDSHAALIALYTLSALPFVIWMMRSYFAGVSAEIEESALVDGSTRLGAFWRITLPLSMPGLIATATFAFIFSWTEFLFAVALTSSKAVTLPVVIAGFTGTQGSNWGRAAALAVIATAPVFVLGLLVQKHFVRGLTLGAVRG